VIVIMPPNPISVWRCDMLLPTVMLCLDEGIGICATGPVLSVLPNNH
jgi:hypothetical protein